MICIKKRIFYLVLVIISAVIGVGSREYGDYLPLFISKYAGDTMWSAAVFFLLRMIFINLQSKTIVLISVFFSVLIEISQLLDASWINAIRQTRVGGLIIGFGFLWSDFLCYFAGIAIAWLIDILLSKQFKKY